MPFTDQELRKGPSGAKEADDLLSHGKIEQLVELIKKLPAIAPAPDASRSLPQIEADSFRSKAERMRSPTFRAKGMPIGSGIVEAACKTVVSTRAKRVFHAMDSRGVGCCPGFTYCCSQSILRPFLGAT